jgi:hypothetical protein
VADPYLREAALRSLANGGDDQEFCYDFSFSEENVRRRGPEPGDLGVLVLMDEEIRHLRMPGSSWRRFLGLFKGAGANVAVLLVTEEAMKDEAAEVIRQLREPDVAVHVVVDAPEDPLTLRRQIALKMLLNAHSTGIMAALGRVIGNTMTNVSPSNLKLIGRATHLILSHVNDALAQESWEKAHGPAQPVSFAEANAVLIDAMDYVRSQEMGQTAEVALSIIRILEALSRGGAVSWEEAREILEREGLARYLERQNPALTSGTRPST